MCWFVCGVGDFVWVDGSFLCLWGWFEILWWGVGFNSVGVGEGCGKSLFLKGLGFCGGRGSCCDGSYSGGGMDMGWRGVV